MPQLALLATWVYAMTGRGDDAIRLTEVAERVSIDGMDPDAAWSFESRRAMTRAVLCRRGPRAMLADAELAVAREPASGRWLTHALWLLGSAHYLLGDLDAAEAALQASTREATAIDSPNLAPLDAAGKHPPAPPGLGRVPRLLTREASARLEQFGYGYLVDGPRDLRPRGTDRRPQGRGACRARGARQGAARAARSPAAPRRRTPSAASSSSRGPTSRCPTRPAPRSSCARPRRSSAAHRRWGS